jgi:hypothetical protein
MSCVKIDSIREAARSPDVFHVQFLQPSEEAGKLRVLIEGSKSEDLKDTIREYV